MCGTGLLPRPAPTYPALTVLKARAQDRDPDPEVLAAVRGNSGWTTVRCRCCSWRPASLGSLGLGAQPSSPEWGHLLAGNEAYAERAPWTVLAALGALAVTATGALRRRAGD